MPLTGEQTQHTAGIRIIFRFFKNLAFYTDYRIGTENDVSGLTRSGAGLLKCKALHEIGRSFARTAYLGNRCRTDNVINTGGAQKIVSTSRGGS